MEITLAILAITVILVIYYIILCIKEQYKYWEKRNVPYRKPTIPFGTPGDSIFNIAEIGRQNKKHYDYAKLHGFKHIGLFIFWKPLYMPVDPQIIKNILTIDFAYFSDRGMYVNEKDDPLTAHLFSLEEKQWRKLRVKLTPPFTSKKLKMMFQVFLECSNQLKNKINKLISFDEAVEMKDMFSKFSTNVIVSSAFGIDCNVFENRDSKFADYGEEVISTTGMLYIKSMFGVAFPNFARRIELKLFDPKITSFFYAVINDTIEYRKVNNVRRNDFLQLLIDMQNNPDDEDQLTTTEIAAQSFVFFLAGFETTSSAMSFCLYELCRNKDIQEKARREVLDVLERHENTLSYNAIVEIKYLDQIVNETLRMYPPSPILSRICVKDYNIPETNTMLEKGTTVLISTLGLHRDPAYFKTPEKFDPERFNEKNKSKIVPFTYLPFGDGPRNCIALRFGLMQMKVGLITILRNYKLSLNSKTEVPIKYDPNTFVLSAHGGIWCNVKKL